MAASLIAFFIKYKFIFLFYAIIILLVYLNRKKIEVQAKFIFLYRMKWGLKWMDKFAKKYREWVILAGYIGAGLGFIGMLVISYTLVKNLYDLIISPATTPGVSLVLPGVTIPGLGILPFWHWLVAIFIIAIVHEFAHGIVARAHNLPVKNTGIVLFGPVIGAFVEPDEKKMKKQSDITQYSVLAAGAFSNVLLAVVAILLLNTAFMPLQESMITQTGFTFSEYAQSSEPFPFEKAGVPKNALITKINDVEVIQFQPFSQELAFHRPGDTVSIVADGKEYDVTLAQNPDQEGKAFLGIQDIRNEFETKEQYKSGMGSVAYYALSWWNALLKWLFILSFGIGLFNLLPLPIVDGGRMLQVFLQKLRGAAKGDRTYIKISTVLLILLVLNLVYPFLSGLF